METVCSKCLKNHKQEETHVLSFENTLICDCGRELDVCQCKQSFIEVDDMGFYGCRECYQAVDVNIRRRTEAKARAMDLTGQDEESWGEQ